MPAKQPYGKDKRKNIRSLITGNFCPKKGTRCPSLPPVMPPYCEVVPLIAQLHCKHCKPQISLLSLNSAGMAFGPFKCHPCNSLL